MLLSGVNHVAIVTSDLNRFIDFYARMFGVEQVFREDQPFRHAILRTGPNSWLHPAEVAGNPNASASPKMFQRGHLDHIALGAASREAFETMRQRLIEARASSGEIEDLGAFHAVWFKDPDGMLGELTLIVKPDLTGIHEPRPYGQDKTAA
jgi:catechol 2,3-dioxygenase-like lactoylglutathione lyase family enzyme